MSGRTSESHTLDILKLFNEIAIVYFLLLVSLRFIEIYSPLTFDKIIHSLQEPGWIIKNALVAETIDKKLCFATSAFAIASGLWNSVMIGISGQVGKQHIKSLFKGHLVDNIIESFPKVQVWQDRIKKKDDLHEEEKSAIEELITEMDKSLKALITSTMRFRKLVILLKSLIHNPHHLILPYFFVFHIVALNYILGIFIFLSAVVGEGKGLWQIQPFVYILLLIVLPMGVLFLLAIHFRLNKGPTQFERFASGILLVTILFIYSICSTTLLITLVFTQQIATNIFVTSFFNIPSATEKEQL